MNSRRESACWTGLEGFNREGVFRIRYAR
jgi:hypothetical protein